MERLESNLGQGKDQKWNLYSFSDAPTPITTFVIFESFLIIVGLQNVVNKQKCQISGF